MPFRLNHRTSRLTLLLCLLGSAGLSPAAAQAHAQARDDVERPTAISRDRQPGWLQILRAVDDQNHRQAQRRLELLERCLERSRRSIERDQCLRRELEARERQWEREQRAWQQLIRQQSRITRLAWQPQF